MYDKKQLEYFSNTEIKNIDRDVLKNIIQIEIDTSLPKATRLIKFLNDIHNPYCFFVGYNAVKIEYTNQGCSLQTLLKDYFIEHLRGNYE